jgi:hypothetical protein
MVQLSSQQVVMNFNVSSVKESNLSIIICRNPQIANLKSSSETNVYTTASHLHFTAAGISGF